MPTSTLFTVLLLAASAGAQVPAATGAAIQINYDPQQVLGESVVSTLANLIYPPAKGPPGDGYPVEPLPVFVTVRGGNSNALVPGVVTENPVQTMMSDLGMLAITFNHPVIDPGEDYRASLVGVQRIVQHLRANAAELNVDPDRVFMHARSLGTYLGYATSFKEDAADPASTDPVLQRSSRPDYLAARIGISSLMCFDLAQGPWTSTISTIVFPNTSFSDSTASERLAESPVWWLLNPGLFGRDRTPPLFLVFNSAHGDVCGQVTDVHSGFLGEEMMRAIDDFAVQSGDERLRARSGSVDKVVWPDVEIPVADWTLLRLAEDFGGLHASTPIGDLTATGGSLSLRAHGAPPGATVEFRSGSNWVATAPAGCPAVEGSFADAGLLGSATAGADGVAELLVTVDAAAMGGVLEYRAIAPGSCAASGRTLHLLIEGAQQ